MGSIAPRQAPAERVRALVAELAAVDGSGWADVDRLQAVTALEELKGACAAAQARVTVAFAESRRAGRDGDASSVSDVGAGSGCGDGVRPSRRRAGRGVGEMVALARRESPTRGDQHVGLAKALVGEMPGLHGLLTRGLVSEWVATRVVQGTATLSREDRQTADARLVGVLPGLGARGAGAAARRVAAELDAASVVAAMVAAVRARRVTVRPAPEGMAYLSVLAPLGEAVGAFAALGRDADAVVGGHGCQPVEGRCRGQVMADLAIQRMGGLAPGQVQPVEIQLVMTDTALFGQANSPTPRAAEAADGTDDPHDLGDSDVQHDHGHEGTDDAGDREGAVDSDIHRNHDHEGTTTLSTSTIKALATATSSAGTTTAATTTHAAAARGRGRLVVGVVGRPGRRWRWSGSGRSRPRSSAAACVKAWTLPAGAARRVLCCRGGSCAAPTGTRSSRTRHPRPPTLARPSRTGRAGASRRRRCGCGGCTCPRMGGTWWRWTPGVGCSVGCCASFWCCGTSPVGCRGVRLRSGRWIMPSRWPAVAGPAPRG